MCPRFATIVRMEKISPEHANIAFSEEKGTEPLSVSPGEQKVLEYVDRIKSGEALSAILDGLPESFALGIAKELLGDIKTPDHIISELDDRGYIAQLLAEEPVDEEAASVAEAHSVELPMRLATEVEKERLSGWPAGYELARVAKAEGVDLLSLSREEYAEYAVSHNLEIDDAQLRAARWERTATSPEEIVARRKELVANIPSEQLSAFSQFDTDMRALAATDNRFLRDGVRVRQGTAQSNSWLFFGINQSLGNHLTEMHKGYLTFKELGKFSPEIFVGYLETLQQAGYNGDVKVFQDMGSQGLLLNDQVVMHGATAEDVVLANDIARQYFGENVAEVGVGVDMQIAGKWKSYSQILAEQVKERIAQNRQA